MEGGIRCQSSFIVDSFKTLFHFKRKSHTSCVRVSFYVSVFFFDRLVGLNFNVLWYICLYLVSWRAGIKLFV